MTADEALGDYESATVALDGHKFEGAIVGRDPSADVAVLRVSGLGAPALPLAAGFTPKTGEIVLSAARHDGSIVARLGIVSMMGGPWLSMRGGQIDSLIRLDVTLDRWGEGGPVIDSEGRAFCMAVRGHRRSVLAIPAATIERVAARILEKGSAKPAISAWAFIPCASTAHRNGADGAGCRARKSGRKGWRAARRHHHGLGWRASCGDA